MHDPESLANGQAQIEEGSTAPAQASADAVAVEVAVVDEDPMDTTPDTDQQLVLPNGSVSQLDTSTVQPPFFTSNSPVTDETDSSVRAESAAAVDNAVSDYHTGSQSVTNGCQTQIEPPLSVVPPHLFEPALHPPPPPPPPVEPVRSDSESSDDEDGMHPWQPIQEDISSPDETELREIEASAEYSALDHEYWESRAFLPVEEPEYTVGVSGRIDWTINSFNGTRETPNREIVMKSDVVTIGGHQWQIKFYPKGNDSDYLSVYLECISVMDSSSKRKDGRVDSVAKEAAAEGSTETRTVESAAHAPAVDHQHTPLPLLGSRQLPKRKSVAAQVSVVMYNPSEPRVNYSRTALHRFCNGSPDWGWTRFHGPHYDVQHRLRGQRQALLRDDKLAFTGYVRIIEDETECLWEHHSRENPWDSFAMTGLQGLMLGEDASAPGGNMISAIALWMLFKPFRKLLYSAYTPDPEAEPFTHPKPLLNALKKVLYMLRTQVEPGAGAVALDDVLDALEWYGIHERINKLDVIETWEVLRVKLEEELQQLPEAAAFSNMFGSTRIYSSGVSYKVPVIGVESIQDAIDQSTDVLATAQELPQLLALELERQEFDSKTRTYVKLLNKVSLDDQIRVKGVPYTLYGFVVHKQTLQSYVYQPVLRPEGPGSRWYSYSDSKDENHVKCLTRKEAIDAHEGKAGPGRLDGNDPVAYIAMYVRADAADLAFKSDVDFEPWDVPQWIQADVERTRNSHILNALPSPPPIDDGPATMSDTEDQSSSEESENEAEVADFQVIDSRIFLQHEGRGIFEAYDSRWTAGNVEHVHTVQLSLRDSCDEIRSKIASVIDDVKDPRQVKFWFMDSLRGSQGRPHLSAFGEAEHLSGSSDRKSELKKRKFDRSHFACRRVWTHIVDYVDLPAPPKEEEKPQDTIEEPPATMNDNVVVDNGGSDVGMAVEGTRLEDTPMSEPDEQELEPEPAMPVQSRPQTPTDVPPVNMGGSDATEDGLPAEHHTSIRPTVHDDTEMGGTQDDLPPPPPPPVDLPLDFMPPPPPPVEHEPSPEPPADEIYFFLKFFNPEKQVLEARGTHIVKKSARVDETLVTCLGLPMEDKKKIDIWEEEELTTLRSIKNRRSFLQVDLHDTSVIIVAIPQTSEQRSALAARAAFADPHSFLVYRAFARNFPSHLNGHYTYNYFSSEYYKGEIKNGHRHGHGKMLYHSGATYEGSFQLGQRHGHGLYTHQNGDTFDGDWVSNQQHGSGTFVEAATGNTYVGGWKNDKKFGEGVTHWKNAQEEERLCRICWEDAADTAFYDCGHVVACLQCAREVQNCPVCRKRVLCAMKLYYVA